MVSDWPRVELDSAEQELLDAIARRQAAVPPRLFDDPIFVGAARDLACRLPLRLISALRRFRSEPGPEGMLHVSGLPHVTDRSTPILKNSVERVPDVPSAALFLCSIALGEVMAFRAEKAGALVQNVVPVPGSELVQSNAGSAALEMHTENAFHEHRPHYVALSCVRQDHDNQAGLRLASVRNVLPHLLDEHASVLRQARFRTAAPPSFGGGREPVLHAVLTGSPADPDIRVDFNATQSLDDDAKTTLVALSEAVELASRAIHMAPGDLVIVDNRVALHGRTSFSPRYDGKDRWLHRTFIHLDGRRTRGDRPDGGFALN